MLFLMGWMTIAYESINRHICFEEEMRGKLAIFAKELTCIC